MDNRKFENKAKELVAKYVTAKIREQYDPRLMAPMISEKQIFIVWSAKILQNNKAILATDDPEDNTMYEITYNGDKKQFYLDSYKKTENIMYHNDK